MECPKKKLIVYGTGSLAEKIFFYNKRDSLYDLVSFIDDNGSDVEFHGIPVIAYQDCLSRYSVEDYVFFVAIGYTNCNVGREKVCKKLQDAGYKLINYISPNSIVFENVVLGSNILICDNVFVGHSSKVSDGVILSVGCILSHENTIGKFSFLSSSVVLGGHAVVENNCFIGLHSTLRDSIKVREFNIVGSASNVIKSTEPYSLTKGNPGISEVRDIMTIKI